MNRRDLRVSPAWLKRAIRVAAVVALVLSPVSAGWRVMAQQGGRRQPVVVQPGAPGSPTRTLPSTTRAVLPPASAADVLFMQGMIVHHAQAVEMTDLIDSHTMSEAVRSLGARISRSQSDEIGFMKRWLIARGHPVSLPGGEMHHMHHGGMSHGAAGHSAMGAQAGKQSDSDTAMMPGMLTPRQMEELRKARGAEFDRLFLAGMIQHHGGALDMVRDLFATAGAGQEADIFTFATDVDSGQRAEIRVMQGMLDRISLK